MSDGSRRDALLRYARDALNKGRLHDAIADIDKARDIDRDALNKARREMDIASRRNDESERLGSEIWREMTKLRPDGSPDCGR